MGPNPLRVSCGPGVNWVAVQVGCLIGVAVDERTKPPVAAATPCPCEIPRNGADASDLGASGVRADRAEPGAGAAVGVDPRMAVARELMGVRRKRVLAVRVGRLEVCQGEGDPGEILEISSYLNSSLCVPVRTKATVPLDPASSSMR